MDTTEWRERVLNRDRVGDKPGALTTRPRCRQNALISNISSLSGFALNAEFFKTSSIINAF